ncbi:uncharacterized protein KY384_001586 [Bacidia gigantensis]|uniref:uncharacterized protein n=1 Tax=Bacidia gigantensis TaxID=2732470 RepID=UPI001D059E51|nr:uncharacterized protein KY384_001586 [Bacidia gigantensis]KAG8533845.1 hypothetical protein KY384_001586 [Bacidia gigantensis]
MDFESGPWAVSLHQSNKRPENEGVSSSIFFGHCSPLGATADSLCFSSPIFSRKEDTTENLRLLVRHCSYHNDVLLANFFQDQYYEVDTDTGNLSLVTTNETGANADFISYSHGVYSRNTHGQEILLRPTNITWRFLGGSVDLYFYAGPTQPEGTAAYEQSAAGLPAIQQYFSPLVITNVGGAMPIGLGCKNIVISINDALRYGYDEGKTFLNGLHDIGRHYIPIIDSAIYVPNPQNEIHPPFGLPGEPGNLVLDYAEGFNLTNATEAASASSASASQASAYPVALTASGFDPSATYLRTTPTPGVRDVNHPPYVINNVQGDLAVHAVSPNATHVGGTLDYEVHNTWGHGILNATNQALLSAIPCRRPFIIGRSTFAGSGKWAGHWGGDNASKWAYMVFLIPQALSFSLFGVPMFGVDTCGFNGNSDEELCNRWMQLSAFLPFYPNHNTLTANSQEAYVWASVAEATPMAIQVRYLMLPYLYTLFHLASLTGSTTMRALSWEFPNEPALANADHQFFLGPALLVTPVLIQGVTSVNGVFLGVGKGECYYDCYNQSIIDPATVGGGKKASIDAPLGHIPLYLRGGYVVPTQEAAMVTRDARKNPWESSSRWGWRGRREEGCM